MLGIVREHIGLIRVQVKATDTLRVGNDSVHGWKGGPNRTSILVAWDGRILRVGLGTNTKNSRPRTTERTSVRPNNRWSSQPLARTARSLPVDPSPSYHSDAPSAARCTVQSTDFPRTTPAHNGLWIHTPTRCSSVQSVNV